MESQKLNHKALETALTEALGSNKALTRAREATFLGKKEQLELLVAGNAFSLQHQWEQEFADCTDLSEEQMTRFLRKANELLKTRAHASNLHKFLQGKALYIVERLIPGAWTNWVVDSKVLSLRTAHYYKNIYEAFWWRPEVTDWYKSTTLYAMSSGRTPKELLQFILENADGVHPASAQDVLLVGELLRTGQIGLDDERVLNLVRSKRRLDYVGRVQREFNKILTKIHDTIAVLQEIEKEQRPEPMLPIGEKNDTYPAKVAIKFLQNLKLVIKSQSDSYERQDHDNFDVQPLHICKDCIYRDDAMTDKNLDYRDRHPDDPTLADAADDLAAIDAEIERISKEGGK